MQLVRLSAQEARERLGLTAPPSIGRVLSPSFIGWNFPITPEGYEPHRKAGGEFMDVPGMGKVPVFDSLRQVRNTEACAQHHGEILHYDRS